MNELFIDLFSIAIMMRQNLVIHNLSITNVYARLQFAMVIIHNTFNVFYFLGALEKRQVIFN